MSLEWRPEVRRVGSAHWVDRVIHESSHATTTCEFTFHDSTGKIADIAATCEREGRNIELSDIHRIIGAILEQGVDE